MNRPSDLKNLMQSRERAADASKQRRGRAWGKTLATIAGICSALQAFLTCAGYLGEHRARGGDIGGHLSTGFVALFIFAGIIGACAAIGYAIGYVIGRNT